MTETELVLDLPNSDKKIHCLLRDVPDKPVVVFVHGLGGSMYEHIHHNGARVVQQAGFATLRVNLYDSAGDARNLMDCTVDTHVDDLRVVLRHLRGQGRHIVLVGHSLGGVVLQRTDRDLFDAAILWDATDAQIAHVSKWSDTTFLPEVNMWAMHWGADCLVSTDLVDSWFDKPDHHDFGRPTLIVAAGGNWLKDAADRYQAAQTGPSKLIEVVGADHCFNNDGAAEQLYVETVSWLRETFSVLTPHRSRS